MRHPHGGAFVSESFRGRFVPTNSYGPDEPIQSIAYKPFRAVRRICEDGQMQKTALRAKVRRIEVRYYDGPLTATWSFSGGVLAVSINPKAPNEQDFPHQIDGPAGLRTLL